MDFYLVRFFSGLLGGVCGGFNSFDGNVSLLDGTVLTDDASC